MESSHTTALKRYESSGKIIQTEQSSSVYSSMYIPEHLLSSQTWSMDTPHSWEPLGALTSLAMLVEKTVYALAGYLGVKVLKITDKLSNTYNPDYECRIRLVFSDGEYKEVSSMMVALNQLSTMYNTDKVLGI